LFFSIENCTLVIINVILNIPEYKSVFLIVFHYDERELLLLEVQLGDLGPEKEANLGFPLKHQDTSGGQAQAEYGNKKPIINKQGGRKENYFSAVAKYDIIATVFALFRREISSLKKM
jgi:hypothetical protein